MSLDSGEEPTGERDRVFTGGDAKSCSMFFFCEGCVPAVFAFWDFGAGRSESKSVGRL